MKRIATANWKGTGKEGKGTVSSQSGALDNNSYTSASRFESGLGTNPEELIAAALAGCFSMKLSYLLNAAGYTPDNIDTQCTISVESGVTEGHLEMKAHVPNIDETKFQEVAQDAAQNCPVRKMLSFNVTMNAELAQ